MLGSTRTNSVPTTIFDCQACFRSQVSDIYPIRTEPPPHPDPLRPRGRSPIALTTAERARDLKPRPAYLAGYGQRLHFEVAGRIGSLADYMEGGRSWRN